MKGLTTISRLLTGSLFIISGLIKANDPIGFGYKLKDYFAPDVLNMEFLIPYVVAIAIVICIAEVVLGCAAIFGASMRKVAWLLLLLIVFFTFLTFYSAWFEKVTDCGCFGDALKLTPWESFWKDAALLLIIVIIFINRKHIHANTLRQDLIYSFLSVVIIALFSAGVIGWWLPALLALIIFSMIITAKNLPADKMKPEKFVIAIPIIFTLFFSIYVLRHLPVKDFRPYAVGKSIPEGMKDCTQSGLPCPQYAVLYTLKEKATGETQKVNSQDYITAKMWEDTSRELISDLTESKLVAEGYQPPIHDFSITTPDGEDVTQKFLSNPGYSFFLIAPDLTKTNKPAQKKINEFAEKCEKAGKSFIGLTASSYNVIEDFRHEVQAMYTYYTTDEKTLQTIERSNPALIMLKNGVVLAKWHFNDFPEYDEVD